MNYRYKIIYDVNKDIWNWYYGAKYSDNSSQLLGADFIMTQKIKTLNKNQSEKLLRPFLCAKKDDTNSELNKFIKIAESEFSEKFIPACEILSSITGQPMPGGEYRFFVTTFPRMVVFYDEKTIFMYAKIDQKLWGMPIDGFLHEGLHIIFDHYWRQNAKSSVSKVSEDDYFKLKESLTVILDEELKPIITLPDNSYPEFAKFRQVLHREWQAHHNFARLVEYGLENLPNNFIEVS